MRILFSLITVVVIFSSCSENHFREDKIFAGGIYAPASTLNLGKQVYTEYCMACHGVEGDGAGVASKGMKVPPRDFRTGVIKFGDVVAGDLPHDESIIKLLRAGLHGTAMLPWDLSDDQATAVVQYIKTFAPKVWEGKDKELGKKIKVSMDPYKAALKSSVIQKGKEAYHMIANCQSCHRAYATKPELQSMSMKYEGVKIDEFDEDLYLPKAQYYDDWNTQVLPPDFTYHELRSINNLEDIYFRLAAGVGGGVMPSWQGTIEEDQIWAIAYYVKYLMDLKENKTARKELLNSLK
ncbi:c-type cytochrome [bacterium]|nr:c-type cytochrome [bacterium]